MSPSVLAIWTPSCSSKAYTQTAIYKTPKVSETGLPVLGPFVD